MRRHGLVCLAVLMAAAATTWGAANAPSWTTVPTPNRGDIGTTLNAVTFVSGIGFAVGHYYQTDLAAFRTCIQRWDGSAWRMMTTPNSGNGYNDLYSVSGTGPNDVWAVGTSQQTTYTATRPLALRWNGSAWQVVSTNFGEGSTLASVAALAPNDAWAVGGSGTQALALHWDGSQWRRVAVPTNSTTLTRLTGVSGVTPDDVWAVGYSYVNRRYQGFIVHWDGARWSIVPSPASPGRTYLGAVAASRADEAWAVGQIQGVGSQILRWDGSSWTPVAHMSTGTVWNVSANGPDVWVVGYTMDSSGYTHTMVQRWDGVRFNPQPAPDPGYGPALMGVALDAGSVWAVGLQRPDGIQDRTLAIRGYR
jgi:hypothetical protein